MAVTELELVLAGIISTGVVGIAGPVITWQIAKAGRAHERRLAHDARMFEQRSSLYLAMLVTLRRELRAVTGLVEWAHDPTGPNPGVPAFPTADEIDELYARVAAFGSNEMLKRVRELRKAGLEAWSSGYEERGALEEGASQEELDANLARLDAIPPDAQGKLTAVERRVRDELTAV